jgi:hypothetical protein
MPFKIINAINAGKEPDDISAFNPWITNRFFSFFPDTLFFAQLMNLNYDLEPKHQLIFLRNTIRPSKRWQKWMKKTENDKYNIVREWYGFSDRKTKDALAVLTDEQIEIIRIKNKKE